MGPFPNLTQTCPDSSPQTDPLQSRQSSSQSPFPKWNPTCLPRRTVPRSSSRSRYELFHLLCFKVGTESPLGDPWAPSLPPLWWTGCLLPGPRGSEEARASRAQYFYQPRKQRDTEAETVWSEKVNSPHLRGTPNRAGGQTPGRGVEKREVWGDQVSRLILLRFYVTLAEGKRCASKAERNLLGGGANSDKSLLLLTCQPPA